MTLQFTEEEKRWLTVDLSKEYTLKCKDDAPKEIKESINDKIREHKKWLDNLFGGSQ